MSAALHTTQLIIDGKSIPVRIRHNPRARRIILRLDHKTGDVVVTSPTKKGMKEALAFAAKEATWIAEKRSKLPKPQVFEDGASFPFRGDLVHLQHCPEKKRGTWIDRETATINVSGDTDFIARRTEDFLRREAKTALTEAVARFTRTMDLPLPRVTVRDTSSRWGSCSTSGALSFSWRLILAPSEILIYVAAHECAHLQHHNHSKAFWRLVASLDPNYREAESWLTRDGADLFRYGGKAPPPTQLTL